MHSRGCPVIGWGLGVSGSGAQSGLRTRFFRQFDALITYSQTGADQYADLGFPRDCIFVAPNATVARPTQKPKPRPPRWKKNATVLFVGRLQTRKKVDNLILACAALPEGSRPRLVIIGDGPARSELETLARMHYPNTEFTGSLHGDDLKPYFTAADLFVLPGTGGLALQQAMSYGLPVIAGVADGTQSDLVRKVNGWQLVDDQVETLVSTLADALAQSTPLGQMGEASYRIVRDEINIERMVEVFLAAIEQVSSTYKGRK
ncbi:MAG: glycosyltransferase [Anaerolineaceae bacterium]|nr:glycosyltransferase [Anaerolineaceae bacterium]